MLVALSGQSIIIAEPSVSEFEGIFQRYEVTAIGANVCGAWDIVKEHGSFIGCLFLAYRAVIHDSGFVRDWNGAFILQNCLFACWQAMYCWSVKAVAFISSYVTPLYLWLILYWADRLLCGTNRKLHIFEAVVLCFVWAHWKEAGTALQLSVYVCWDTGINEGCHPKKWVGASLKITFYVSKHIP